MNRLNKYRKIVCDFLEDFAKNDANAQLIFDIARDRDIILGFRSPSISHGADFEIDSIRLVSISPGADFEIDLSAFPESEPVFAYVDDVGCHVDPLSGLVIDGRMTIENQPPFMWLNGARNCVLLKASVECRQGLIALFRSLAVGEFCLEIYHVYPDKGVELLHRDDFCFK
jgi:hypothetical protein